MSKHKLSIFVVELTLTIQFDFCHCLNFKEFIAYIYMGWFTCSKCMVASLLWFAYFGSRIGGDAQLLSCCYLVDHICIHLISKVSFIGHMFHWGDKTRLVVLLQFSGGALY